MRVVLDTNGLVSTVLKDSSIPAMAVHLVHQRGRWLKSAATERQLLDVIARPSLAALIAPAASDWLKGLLAAAETVEIKEQIAACRDPTDDADLLVLNPFRDIPIVPPAVFVEDIARWPSGMA